MQKGYTGLRPEKIYQKYNFLIPKQTGYSMLIISIIPLLKKFTLQITLSLVTLLLFSDFQTCKVQFYK